MKKLHIVALLVILAAAAVWFAYGTGHKSATAPSEEQATTTPAATPNATTSAPQVSGSRFAWSFAEMEEDASGVPSTRVMLTDTTNGKKYDLGARTGSCSTIESSSWTLLAGEQTGVICWFAGGGEELGVFQENGSLIVKAGILEEGTAETPGLRGDFKTFAVIE